MRTKLSCTWSPKTNKDFLKKKKGKGVLGLGGNFKRITLPGATHFSCELRCCCYLHMWRKMGHRGLGLRHGCLLPALSWWILGSSQVKAGPRARGLGLLHGGLFLTPGKNPQFHCESWVSGSPACWFGQSGATQCHVSGLAGCCRNPESSSVPTDPSQNLRAG